MSNYLFHKDLLVMRMFKDFFPLQLLWKKIIFDFQFRTYVNFSLIALVHPHFLFRGLPDSHPEM